MALTPSEIYYFDISKVARDYTGSKDIAILYNDQALLESVTNIIATEPGQRIMYPDFGTKLNQYVFEPIDPITAFNIQKEIEFALTKYEPRIENLFINVTPQEDLNTYTIDVLFNLKINNTVQQKLILQLNKIR